MNAVDIFVVSAVPARPRYTSLYFIPGIYVKKSSVRRLVLCAAAVAFLVYFSYYENRVFIVFGSLRVLCRYAPEKSGIILLLLL